MTEHLTLNRNHPNLTMKLTTIKIACATLLGAALLAWGDEPPDGAKARVFGSGVLSDHLSMYDVDDSGGVDGDRLAVESVS